MLRYARSALLVLAIAVLAIVMGNPAALAQFAVLNRFLPVTGGSQDNILEINGTLEFEDVVTVLDHGTTTLDGTPPTNVTTNLSSITECVVTMKNAITGASPGDDPVYLTALYTSGSAVLSIFPWKNTSGTDPTLVASGDASVTVGYWCAGAD